MENKIRIVVSIGLIVTLAGCSGMTGIGGPSITDTEVRVVDGQSVLSVEYDVDDYARAIFEGPDGRIIYERSIEPDHTTTNLSFPEPKGGEYELLIRQGDETVASETMNFEGPDVHIRQIESEWTGNSLESVQVSVHNNGDLPLYVTDAHYTINEADATTPVYGYLDSNNSATVEIESTFGEAVPTNEPGQIEGDAILQTSDGNATESFSRTLEPASLEIVETESYWEENILADIEVTVRNNGDVPTSSNLSLEHESETIGTSRTDSISPNQTVQFGGLGTGFVYGVESGGTAEFDVLVNSPSGVVSESFSREIAGADLSIESMNMNWDQGRLTELQYTADNGGDLDADVSVVVDVNGETVQEYTGTISSEGGEYNAIDVPSYSDPVYIADSGGEYEVTLSIETEEGVVTESESVTFGGIDSSITNIDTTFFSSFDSDGSELTSLDFSVRNEGDIILQYDSIEISIDGASRENSLTLTSELVPGESTNEYVSILENIAVSSGSHELTIELQYEGETVASETTTVSP